MAGEIDPRYAARFRRDYLPEAGATLPGASDGAGDGPSPLAVEPLRPRRAPGVVLLALALVLAVLAMGAAAWEVLDTAFRVPSARDPLAATRTLARAAPGPLLVAVVPALTGGLLLVGLPRRAVVVAATAIAAALAALVARAAIELARLTSLTTQGPVSSGGIPLPDPALAVYFERVQMVAVLDRMLPWLVLAVALEVVAAAFLAGTLSSRRSA